MAGEKTVYKAPRGTADILPQEQPYWGFVRGKAEALCHIYGYQRLDTPAFEEAGLFIRTIGSTTDIVEKEMYTFQDRGGKHLTLRPEGTAPVCRAYLEHGLHNLPQPVKLYYFASIYRYERPQKGRYREHHQFGFEAIGDADPALDAEVIDLAWQLYSSLGLKGLSLKLNSIGCRACRPDYVNKLRQYYRPYIPRLCPECRERLEKNALRLLDCKQASCQVLALKAPKSTDHLCPPCKSHFDALKAHLEALHLPYDMDHRLVRGLDYYTRTVFEVQPPEEGAQSTLGGGGRYDDLIEELGGRPTPAVGFATGMERIVVSLKKAHLPLPSLPQPTIFVAYAGEENRDQALALLNELRRAEIGAIGAPAGKSLRAQLRQADALGMAHALILGEEEMRSETVVLRNLATGAQTSLPRSQLISHLRRT
jgi:histidyl-tRNA synthetase